MATTYIPILKAKKGEFVALENMHSSNMKDVIPLFEIAKITDKDRELKKFRDSRSITCDFLDEVAERITNVQRGRKTMVDTIQWMPESTTETGEHVTPYIYSRLNDLGVDVVPVIGYDRWESLPYRLALKGLSLESSESVYLRLDSHAIEDSEDEEYFEEQVVGILEHLSLAPSQCSILIDFGDVTAIPIDAMTGGVKRIIGILGGMGFRSYATAGCSLPTTINNAVPERDSTGKILRKEMLVWQTMNAEYPKLRWDYSDYGVRNPVAADNIISPHTNGKIRHTIPLHYFVARGHSLREGNKGKQMHDLARHIVDSVHFMGETFSWGDEQILACSREEFSGNTTQWISIDTNHHVAFVVAEVEEFALKVAARIASKSIA